MKRPLVYCFLAFAAGMIGGRLLPGSYELREVKRGGAQRTMKVDTITGRTWELGQNGWYRVE